MKTWKLILLIAALAAVVAAGAVGGRWYGDNRKPNFTGKADLYVYPGMSVSEVLEAIPDSVVSRPGGPDGRLLSISRFPAR